MRGWMRITCTLHGTIDIRKPRLRATPLSTFLAGANSWAGIVTLLNYMFQTPAIAFELALGAFRFRTSQVSRAIETERAESPHIIGPHIIVMDMIGEGPGSATRVAGRRAFHEMCDVRDLATSAY